jgi:hypothetical protein
MAASAGRVKPRRESRSPLPPRWKCWRTAFSWFTRSGRNGKHRVDINARQGKQNLQKAERRPALRVAFRADAFISPKVIRTGAGR